MTHSLIQQELTQFGPGVMRMISEAGGVGEFLSKCLHFYYLDGYVSLMRDAAKLRARVDMNREQGVKVLPRKLTLPPDTRSTQQFPSLGDNPSGFIRNYNSNNHVEVRPPNLNLVRSSVPESVAMRAETLTPDSQATSGGSDPLDNFFTTLSQTLSQSSIGDGEKTDPVLSALMMSVDDKFPAATSGDAGNSLFMPSAYGDAKSQESATSETCEILPGILTEEKTGNDAQSDRDHSPLEVDTDRVEEVVGTPPMTSPGLIHDIMGGKPLNQNSMSSHPLLARVAPPNSPQGRQTDVSGKGRGVVKVGREARKVINSVQNKQPETLSPLPKARTDLPLVCDVPVSPAALSSRLTPEQATITPPRPRAQHHPVPDPMEQHSFSARRISPPHPDQDDGGGAVPSLSTLISMASAPPQREKPAAPSWLHVDPSEPAGENTFCSGLADYLLNLLNRPQVY